MALKIVNSRDLDIEVSEIVFNAPVTCLHQTHGWRIDYVSTNKECNDPIYCVDMVDGWQLKKYSTNDRHAMSLLNKFKKFSVTKRDANNYCVSITDLLKPDQLVSVQADGESFAEASARAAILMTKKLFFHEFKS
jgi:hypothetical protein